MSGRASNPLLAPLAAALRRRVLGMFPRGQSGIDYDTPADDLGFFGPESVTWRIHSDFPGMLAGGLCALMLQALHPRVLAGVWDHSDFRDDLVGRLRRTTAFVAGTSFAGTTEAQRLIARVRVIHGRVRGETADGQRYAADDPGLLAWVHASEAYAFLQGFRRYGGLPVPDRAEDRYYREGVGVARALGAIEVPDSRAALDAYFDAHRPALRHDARSREVLHVLSRIRLTVPGATVTRGLFLGAGAALLPPWATSMLDFTPLQRARHAACARALETLAPMFRLALPDGAGPHACRRLTGGPAHVACGRRA